MTIIEKCKTSDVDIALAIACVALFSKIWDAVFAGPTHFFIKLVRGGFTR